MPVYEYQCNRCHHEFEEFTRSMASPSKPACPECGGTQVSRKQSVFAAHQGVPKCCQMLGGAGTPPPCASGACPMMH